MKLPHWLELILLALVLPICSSQSGTGTPAARPCLFCGASPTLPAPVVGVTHAPSAEGAMRNFLEALKKNDFAGMYALLSQTSQEGITQDDFTRRYDDALNSLSAASLDYEVLS